MTWHLAWGDAFCGPGGVGSVARSRGTDEAISSLREAYAQQKEKAQYLTVPVSSEPAFHSILLRNFGTQALRNTCTKTKNREACVHMTFFFNHGRLSKLVAALGRFISVGSFLLMS